MRLKKWERSSRKRSARTPRRVERRRDRCREMREVRKLNPELYALLVNGNREAAAQMMAAERTRIEESRRSNGGGGGIPRGMMALTFALGAFASVASPRRRGRR
jgi:hypothetical protein